MTILKTWLNTKFEVNNKQNIIFYFISSLTLPSVVRMPHWSFLIPVVLGIMFTFLYRFYSINELLIVIESALGDMQILWLFEIIFTIGNYLAVYYGIYLIVQCTTRFIYSIELFPYLIGFWILNYKEGVQLEAKKIITAYYLQTTFFLILGFFLIYRIIYFSTEICGEITLTMFYPSIILGFIIYSYKVISVNNINSGILLMKIASISEFEIKRRSLIIGIGLFVLYIAYIFIFYNNLISARPLWSQIVIYSADQGNNPNIQSESRLVHAPALMQSSDGVLNEGDPQDGKSNSIRHFNNLTTGASVYVTGHSENTEAAIPNNVANASTPTIQINNNTVSNTVNNYSSESRPFGDRVNILPKDIKNILESSTNKPKISFLLNEPIIQEPLLHTNVNNPIAINNPFNQPFEFYEYKTGAPISKEAIANAKRYSIYSYLANIPENLIKDKFPCIFLKNFALNGTELDHQRSTLLTHTYNFFRENYSSDTQKEFSVFKEVYKIYDNFYTTQNLIVSQGVNFGMPLLSHYLRWVEDTIHTFHDTFVNPSELVNGDLATPSEAPFSSKLFYFKEYFNQAGYVSRIGYSYQFKPKDISVFASYGAVKDLDYWNPDEPLTPMQIKLLNKNHFKVPILFSSEIDTSFKEKVYVTTVHYLALDYDKLVKAFIIADKELHSSNQYLSLQNDVNFIGNDRTEFYDDHSESEFEKEKNVVFENRFIQLPSNNSSDLGLPILDKVDLQLDKTMVESESILNYYNYNKPLPESPDRMSAISREAVSHFNNDESLSNSIIIEDKINSPNKRLNTKSTTDLTSNKNIRDLRKSFSSFFKGKAKAVTLNTAMDIDPKASEDSFFAGPSRTISKR